MPPAHAGTTTFTVTSTEDPGDGNCATNGCTLREAITGANAEIDKNPIAFNISGTAPHTIAPASELPPLTEPVVIDGTTQPGWSGTPIIVINGDSAGNVQGLQLTGGDSLVRGLVVNGFDGADVSSRAGIHLSGGGGNVIAGNYIGTNAAGSAASPNWYGIHIASGNNVIGGTNPGDANLLAGNYGVNLLIQGEDADANEIYGNTVGLNAAGNTAPFQNGNILLQLGADDNIIGGPTIAKRNVVEGGAVFGQVALFGDASANKIQGNYLGTDATGNVNVSTSGPGVILRDHNGVAPHDNIIGGKNEAEGNVISGNTTGVEIGVEIAVGVGHASGNKVQNNLIGTTPNGKDPLPNTGHGVAVFNRDNLIGGPAGTGNVIAHNGLDGVSVVPDPDNTGTPIKSNSIHSNGGLGIDLDADGMNPNDPQDADAGANNIQNFPVITYIAPAKTGGFLIKGRLQSLPETDFTVQFFASGTPDPTGFGEGKRFLGQGSATTNDQGKKRFSVTLPTRVKPGEHITATATAPDGSTSEFSKAKQFCTHLGSGLDDLMSGTGKPDVMCGLGGDDKIEGLGKKDVLLGGTGNDKLFGGGGKDLLFGQKGDDKLDGGPGRDSCFQGPGSGPKISC